MIIIENIKTITCKCDICSNKWRPNVNNNKNIPSTLKDRDLPKICPKCKSYNWNKKGEIKQ